MNGIIIIDKPEGWTSHDVVGKLRGLLRERRIGHGGTLDPMATGVLPVFVGRATRAAEFCESAEKEYIARLRLGTETDTQDITGNITRTSDNIPQESKLVDIIPEFLGKQLQLPPMYSAVKIGGKKLYELARKGREVERAPREIEIKSLEIEGWQDGDAVLRIVCSKGTYVRTLCADIGAKLGCGGCMSGLRRVRAGAFTADDAVTLEKVACSAAAGCAGELLRPVDSLFAGYPEAFVGEEAEKKCRCGADFPFDGPDGQKYRVYSENGEFLMLGKAEDSHMKTIKSFFEVS